MKKNSPRMNWDYEYKLKCFLNQLNLIPIPVERTGLYAPPVAP